MSDQMLIVAKLAPTEFAKDIWYTEINKRAELQRKPGEPRETSFVRYIETDPVGAILMAAYRSAEQPRRQSSMAKTTAVGTGHIPESLVRLRLLAAEHRAANPSLSPQQAMAKILATEEGSELYRAERNERLANCRT